MSLETLARSSACFITVSLLIAANVARGDAPPTISETVFSAPILDIKWIGPEKQVVILQTQDGLIHRSTDGGKVWKQITRQIGGPALRVSSIVLSPANKKVLAAISTNHEHYVTEDAGVTWRVMMIPPGKTKAMWFHDTRPTWALFSSWTHSCKWVHGAPRMKGEAEDGGHCNHELYATKDLGRTFVKIAGHVLQFDWGDAPHEDRIYFTHFKNKDVPQPRFDHWMADVSFAYTDHHVDDDWTAITNVISGGNKFVVSHGYIIVATVLDKKLGLMVSKDAGSTFKHAIMPRHLKEASYIVLDTSEASVVLHVNHGHGIGHIYASDIDGVHYTLSLANNVRGHSDCAFERVMNLRGIYLANVRDPAPSDFAAAPGLPTLAPVSEETEDHLGQLFTKTQADRAVRTLSESSMRDKIARRLRMRDEHDRRLGNASERVLADANIRTVISFDRGGAWSYVKPPKKDSLGDAIDCPPDKCWLHMHDITEFRTGKFVPFYSYTNAVGIIMGTGNVGPYLTHDPQHTNTYLSRDGGLSWSEAHKGDFIYEFGNHGGLLIMANWLRETTLAFYSTNQGYSWKSVKFSDQPMNVSNILTELTAMSTKFVVFGLRGRQGVLYHLDFAATGTRLCKGLNAADTEASDYETWTPSDGKSEDRCLLGRQRIYRRRKQRAECLNSKDLDWPKDVKNCTCTDEDFECESGFVRSVESMKCLPEHPSDFYEDEEGNKGVCGDKDWHDMDAYRKVAGGSCTNGWSPEKFRLPCGALRNQAELLKGLGQHRKSRWFSWPLFVKGLVVLAGLVVVCCLSRSERVRNCLYGVRMKLTGQRDYSHSASQPPSAVNDPTNIGVPNKEMQVMP